MHIFMAPITERAIKSLSCVSAQLCITYILHGPLPTTLKATLLNIVVSHARVRSEVRSAVVEGIRGEGEFQIPSSYDANAINFWRDVFGNWDIGDCGEIGYQGNVLEFLEGVNDFHITDGESFLEEWCIPYVAQETVVERGDWLLLEILGRSGWASLCIVVNQAISVALERGGTTESMRTFEAALAIGMYRRKRVRQMFLFTDWRIGGEWKATPGVPERGAADWSSTTTAFEVCSRQPPNCETAAKILRSLLTTLKMGDVQYPRFSVVFLRYAFMVALEKAVEISGAVPVRLRVLEVWLECCEDILVPRGHSQWRTALRLNNAELLRETLCVWADDYYSPIKPARSRFSSMDWRLKKDNLRDDFKLERSFW
jgi:hypothetical protein